MALPLSGPISLQQVQTEFGGTSPISVTEYYAAASGVPSSGTISLSQFYGKSGVTTTTMVAGGGYNDDGFGSVIEYGYNIDPAYASSFGSVTPSPLIVPSKNAQVTTITQTWYGQLRVTVLGSNLNPFTIYINSVAYTVTNDPWYNWSAIGGSSYYSTASPTFVMGQSYTIHF